MGEDEAARLELGPGRAAQGEEVVAAEVNGTVENIGARRLYTVMERVFEDLSFAAPDKGGDEVRVDAAFVERELGELSRSADLSRYVL